MEQGKVHIDDLFRRKAQPNLTLPPAAWDNMKLRLDQGRPRYGLGFRWLWYALSVLVVVGIGGYLLLRNTGNTQSTANEPAGRLSAMTGIGNVDNLAKGKDTAGSAVYDDSSLSPKRNAGIVKKNAPSSLETNVSQKLKEKTIRDHAWQDIPPMSGMRPANNSISQAANADSGGHTHIAEMDIRARKNGKQAQQDTASVEKTITMRLPISLAQPALLYAKMPERHAAADNPKAVPVNGSPSSAVKATPAVTKAPAPNIATSNRDTEKVATEKSAANLLSVSASANNADSSAPQTLRRARLLFDFGIKAGYEAGIGRPSVNKFAAAPYLQYHFGSGFSVSLQPTIKWGHSSGITAPAGRGYYNTTGTTVDSQTITKNGHPFWQITYTQNYDSITVGYSAITSSIEGDVPLILRYHLKNGLSFGGGMDVAFGKLITIEEQRQSVHQAQTAVFEIEKAGTHPPPDTSQSFHHTVPSYATYIPLGQAAQSPVRIGYLISAGYEHKRWLVEAFLQQMVSGLSGISVQPVKDAYKLPYLRLLLGYRLSKK